jgi:5-methylcytosine-specific restriction endonuclease McrA
MADPAEPAMAGAGGSPARGPAPAEAAAEADKPPAAADPQPDIAVADAGQEPAPVPGTERKRKKRRGKRGGRKRNRRRKAQAAGAAAEPAAEPAGDPDSGTAPERTDGGTAAKPSRTKPSRTVPPGKEPPAGPEPAADADHAPASPRGAGRRPRKKATYVPPPLPPPPPRPEGPDPSVLSPGKSGVIWMRGRTDNGRRWRQETDLETAVTLVREYAAVVVNRRTIRRLYSNKAFREYILQRDNYTCYFCGRYGDTIDHIVPRAKGGHTTPLNCVTACRECNQNKAALDLEEFMERQPPRSGEPI